MALASSEYRTELGSLDAVAVLVQHVKESDYESVIYFAIAALWSLACNNRQNRGEMTLLDLVPVLVDLMLSNTDDKKVIALLIALQDHHLTLMPGASSGCRPGCESSLEKRDSHQADGRCRRHSSPCSNLQVSGQIVSCYIMTQMTFQ